MEHYLSAKNRIMAKPVEVPAYYRQGFISLALLTDEEFELVVKALEESTVNTTLKEFTQKLNWREPAADRVELGKTVWGMGALRNQMRKSEWKSLVKPLAKGIEKLLDPADKVEGVAERISKRCYKLLEASTASSYSAKAYELVNTQDRTLEKFRVITDIRPVFGDDVEKDSFYSVVFHSLVFKVKELDIERQFTITVDLPEIISMIKDLERAIQKEKTIRSGHTRALPYIRHYRDTDE